MLFVYEFVPSSKILPLNMLSFQLFMFIFSVGQSIRCGHTNGIYLAIANVILLKTMPFIKGPVKLIKRVKTAHSFSQSVSSQFHVIILSLPM